MASGSFSVSTSNGYISGVINWSESQQNSSADTSVVYAEMRLSRTNSGYTSYGSDTFYITINGTQFSNYLSYSLTQNSNTLMVSGSVTVTHNSDGTKSITIGWSGGGGSGGVFTVNASSGTAVLDTLPRASTVSSNVSWTAGTQDLAISLNVADSSFHHTLQIFVADTSGAANPYGNPIGQRDNIGSSTTWSFTQAEITAIYQKNNGYENRPVILRVYTYNSSGSQIGDYQDKTGTVYAIPTATITLNSNNTFNIGDTIPYTLANYTTGSSGGFTYDFVFTFGSHVWTIANNTAQSGNITFASADVTAMYQQIPNANSGAGNVRVRTYYNGVSTEDGNPATDQTNFTANVTNSNPTFTGGFTYADTKSAVTSVTGNNQYIVQNQSTVNVTLPSANVATANNAATMRYYTAILANATGTINVPVTAPTLSTATTGGNLVAATYYVKYTWVTAAGESLPSPETSIVVPTGTSTNTITVTIPSLPTGVTKANIYISTGTGTETLQGNTTGTTYTQTAVLASGAAMPTSIVFSLGTINATVNTNMIVKAVDSRGNSTSVTLSVNIVPYSLPVVNATAARNNGFDANTVLTLSGSASAVSVAGTNKNSIVSAQYQTRQKGGTFGALSNFTITGFPNYSATNVTLTLDNTLAWDINFVVTDKFGNTSVIQSVSAGTPLMAVDSGLSSVGFNQFPTHTKAAEFTGSIYFNTNPFVTEQTATVPATAGWYRVAQTASGMANNLAEFEILAPMSSHHSYTKLVVGINYGDTDLTLTQLAHNCYGTPSTAAVTQARIVYNTSWSGNYAYLEIYWTNATSNSVTVRMVSGTGWSLITPNTAGSIPSGYTSTSINLQTSGIVTVGKVFENGGTAVSPAGMISMFAGGTSPSGWLVCDGSAVSRTTYASLYSAIGTTYGTGDGSTTFNLPNLKGKVPVGMDSGQTEFASLNTSGGEKTHTLSINEMPSHNHGGSANYVNDAGQGTAMSVQSGSSYGLGYNASYATSSTGGGAAHNNLQPYITLNFIIKT